jgi:hypothetical protein
MNKLLLNPILFVSIIYLSGCMISETKTTVSTHPDAEEVLRLDENANIFQWQGLIYKTDIDWVNELELTKKEVVGEITELYKREGPNSFRNGMANQLPIGTKIYKTNENEGILIIEHNGEEKYYLALVEG